MRSLRQMLAAIGFLCSFAIFGAHAQHLCAPTPVFSPCEIDFEINDAEMQKHPAPWASVEIAGEIRSPHKLKTYLVPAFWRGSNRFTIRFSPSEAGDWAVRLSSNVGGWQDKEIHFTATPSEAPGFVETINVHHFLNTATIKAHLWMGAALPDVASLPREAFEEMVRNRARQKFTHLRLNLFAGEAELSRAIPTAANAVASARYMDEIDSRVRQIQDAGLTTDIVLAPDPASILKLLPDRDQRRRFFVHLIARYAGLNVTWIALDHFESVPGGRDLAQEIAGYLKTADSYSHPASCGSDFTSGPLLPDGWQKFLSYRGSDSSVPLIEHLLFPIPGVNDFSASGPSNQDAIKDPAAFRKALWNSSMNGQYPEPHVPSEEAAHYMSVWQGFFTRTRWWELEPYFDATGGRALALPGIEYVIYQETPGPLAVTLDESHKYEVEWVNPLTGDRIPMKEIKADQFSGQPPDLSHDWILHLSRESKKASMLKDYKFESQPVPIFETESAPEKIPFEILQPSGEALSLASAGEFSVQVKRASRATGHMTYVWTGEVSADAQGYRVIGTGAQGTLRISHSIAQRYPAVLHIRLYGMNLYGKIFVTDKIATLNP